MEEYIHSLEEVPALLFEMWNSGMSVDLNTCGWEQQKTLEETNVDQKKDRTPRPNQQFGYTYPKAALLSEAVGGLPNLTLHL